MPMKLLRIISSMDPKSGGPAQGIRNMNTHSATLGVDVTVVCLDNEDVDYGVIDDFEIVRLGKGKTGFKFNTILKRWLIENLSDFDVALVDGLWQYHNYAVFKAIRRLKITNKLTPKVAIMPHGMLDPYFQNAPERRKKAIRNRLIWRLTERKAINAADAMFFTCQSELELARTTFSGYKPKSEVNVGYGIKYPPKFKVSLKNSFLKQCKGLNGNDYLLFLSRIDSKKGVDVLIETYQNLITEGVSLPDLVIAGPTTNEYAKAMIQKAKSTTTIHFPGMLTGDAKWGAFYGASLFVLPSYQENFGIAIVEAMACSVPVLITKQVNIWQEIVEANAGWAINRPDVQDLKEQLKQFCMFTIEEKKLVKINAKDAFEKLYQVEKKAKVFVEQLKTI